MLRKIDRKLDTAEEKVIKQYLSVSFTTFTILSITSKHK